ncbi:MAG: hypothetical protein ABI317_13370 [Gaiellales bacterium]
MRPIRSLIVFAAGATAATPRGRAAAKRALGAARKARQKHHTWHEVPEPGDARKPGA